MMVTAEAELAREPHLLTAATACTWGPTRAYIQQHFLDFLGRPDHDPSADGHANLVRQWKQSWCEARLYSQVTGPGTRQLVLLLAPHEASSDAIARPCAVVPFYHPDESSGIDLGQHWPAAPPRNRPDAPLSEDHTIAYGRHLVDRGYVVACTEAFHVNVLPPHARGEKERGFSQWVRASQVLLRNNPGWSGMGKLVHDVRLATDLLLGQSTTAEGEAPPWVVDAQRLLCVGHSLGGKMAFYSSCLDQRIQCVICSDFGIGLGSTNWQDDWYLGPSILSDDGDDGASAGAGAGAEAVSVPPAGRSALMLGHQHLLALLAPRSFLLVAGEYDGQHSRPWLEVARHVWRALAWGAGGQQEGAQPSDHNDGHGRGGSLQMINHATGHRPSTAATEEQYAWLHEQMERRSPQPPRGGVAASHTARL